MRSRRGRSLEGRPGSSRWIRGSLPGSPAGSRNPRSRSSLPALLHVGLDELLGILLEHGVDLVDDLVHLVLEILALRAGFGLFGCLTRVLTLLDAPLLLLLWHLPSTPHV